MSFISSATDVPSVAWANRPDATIAGADARIIINDLPSGARGQWHSDGTVWKPCNPIVLFDNTSAVVGIASVAEQILKQAVIPGSLLRGLRTFDVVFTLSKSGATDAVTTTSIRFGPLGTTGDTAVYSTSQFTAPNRQYSGGCEWFASSDTTIRTRPVNQNVAPLSGSPLAGAFPTQSVVSNLSVGNFFLSVTAIMAGTTDTPSGNHLMIIGF